MKIIKSTKNIEGKYPIKNSTRGNVAIKAATNKNSSARLQMKEELMDQILSEIKSKLKEIMTSYQFGYDDNEWEDYSGADIYLDNRGYIVITVYAEVSYKGLVKIMDALNPIVEKYDSDAYFDAETSGRCSAYIDPDNIPSNMYPYDDIQNSEKIYSSQSQYTNRTVLKYKNKSFTIYDNSDSINLPTDADLEALRKWKAQISQQAGAYNDADEDYEWASLSNGVVSYYRRGKLVDKSYYMSPSDWGVETLEEWFQSVINDVLENLYEANRDVPDHMVYNSTDIEDVSAGDNPMSFRYKGRRIKLLTDGTGYAIYEKGEMIDYGFKSLEDAEAAIDEYDDIYQDDVQVYSATEEYDEEELQDIIDELTSDGFDVTDEADLLMGLGADLGMDRSDARYYAKLILNHMDDSSVLGASNEVELDPEESMIDMNIDQYIIVDSEGSWNYDSDNYDWASSDGEGSDWYSDNGVRLDDSTGVVEKIDELIEPHVPIEPGTYRVQGYVELYYTVSGVYENRYDYTEDDYSSDINSDFGSAEYNKKLSKIENVKVTKI